jgi:hypothetical protein
VNEVTTDIIIPEKWASKFDLIVKECSGVMNAEGLASVADSLKVMNGIRSLKKFFQQEDVKKLVKSSQDSVAGFLTDRSPAIIARHNANTNKRYDLKPYEYEQIVEALIPCALEGYRLHGNEINIISGKGMPVKAGKYRKIIEATDGFIEAIGLPTVQGEYALVKCKAKWKIGEKISSIGHDEDDPCNFKIKFGRYDSMDKIIGLAQSKLYSRVLTRITGKFIGDEPAPTGFGAKDITDKVPKPEQKQDFGANMQEETPPKKEEPVEEKPPAVPPAVQELIELRNGQYAADFVNFVKAFKEYTQVKVNKIIENNDAEAARVCINDFEQFAGM